MKVTRLRHTSESKTGCPSLYLTDRDTFVVQGWVVNDSALASIDIPAGEAVVEVPIALLREVSKRVEP